MIVLQNHIVRLILWLTCFGFHVVRSHVWGHFCLSYADKQLINDKVLLRNFGIKDGDQVGVTDFYFFSKKKVFRNICELVSLWCIRLVSCICNEEISVNIIDNTVYIAQLYNQSTNRWKRRKKKVLKQNR